jgi:hypothetical protein
MKLYTNAENKICIDLEGAVIRGFDGTALKPEHWDMVIIENGNILPNQGQDSSHWELHNMRNVQIGNVRTGEKK